VPEILTVGNKRNRDTLWLSGMCLSPGAAGSVLPDRWYRVERPSGKPDTLKGAHRSSPVRCPPFRVSAPSLYRYAGYGFASVCEPRREQTMTLLLCWTNGQTQGFSRGEYFACLWYSQATQIHSENNAFHSALRRREREQFIQRKSYGKCWPFEEKLKRYVYISI